MDTKKFAMGTLVGGVAFFFLGYLAYGLALASFFKEHATGTWPMREMGELVWWALILGNIFSGALLTWIFLKMGNVNSAGSGVRIGGTIAFFYALSFDLIRYGTENFVSLKATLVDVVVQIVIGAISGGIIAVVIGMGAKKAA